ncbi:MAG TPA: Rrf2 family transcriptional regulator [Candidatus Sericytochromatia bacterium]
MIELSSKVKYALLALLELASRYDQGSCLQIEQLAAVQQIPARYLAQLLMMLRRDGLVRSQRGARGGYVLAREPRRITVFEILTCLEGNQTQEQLSQIEQTAPDNLLIAQLWQEAAVAANQVFQRYTLQDLCDQRNQGKLLNPMYYI